MTFNSYTKPGTIDQNFKYNGVEQVNDLGLNLTMTLFRPYDPALGRFTGIDPLADFFAPINPYSFGFNNPITFGDPDGLGPIDWLLKLLGIQKRENLPNTSVKVVASNTVKYKNKKKKKGNKIGGSPNPPKLKLPSPPVADLGGFQKSKVEEIDYEPRELPNVKKKKPEPARYPNGSLVIAGTKTETRAVFGDEKYTIPKSAMDKIIKPIAEYLKQNSGTRVDFEFRTAAELDKPLPKDKSMTGQELLDKRGAAFKRAFKRLGVDPSRIGAEPKQHFNNHIKYTIE